MLKITLDGNILTVIETIMSFTDTKISYWYYNIMTWKKSNTGKQNASIDTEMTTDQIDYVKKYYLEKL